MKPLRIAWLALLILAASLTLAACGFSMAEDITPPPNAQANAPQAQASSAENTPEPVPVVFPLVAPDPANGEALFAEKCTPCHGERGLGDGPQGAQLPNPPAPLGDAAFARQFAPAEWYDTLTNGRIDRYMPPFDSMSEGERWDVVAYAMSLSVTPDSLARGELLYQENCQRCHGENGDGDGPDSAEIGEVPAFTNQAFMAQRSAETMAVAIAHGHDEMPGFGEKGFVREDLWALTDYLRSLSFAGGSAALVSQQPDAATPTAAADDLAASPVPTDTQPSATPEQALGTISGLVTNATPDGDGLPIGEEVVLYAVKDMNPVYTRTTTVQEDGTFTFEDVEIDPHLIYLAAVEYNGATYGSDIGMFTAEDTAIDLPITVYESTQDPSVLSVDRLHIFFDFTHPDVIQVVELYVISNNSGKALVPAEQGEGVTPFTLPEGAGEPQFQDGVLGGRYLPTEDGFMDTVSVRPGQGEYQVLYAFTVPYDRKMTFRQTMPLDVDAVLFMVPDGVKVKSDQLEDGGTRDVQGTLYRTFNGTEIAAGGTLEAVVSGSPAAADAAPETAASNNNLAIGLGAFGAVLIGAGIWLYRRNAVEEEELEEDEETDEAEEEAGMDDDIAAMDDPQVVMDAIIALDDLYKEGELPEDAYRTRRAELKTRLQELLEDESA